LDYSQNHEDHEDHEVHEEDINQIKTTQLKSKKTEIFTFLAFFMHLVVLPSPAEHARHGLAE
jgi:hypothetical protein